eukprot:CCRYP_012475-RA/>CCRYP_012475-RA protein AED:0.48 eAED:0.66 QI:0/0/0/1/0/0/3/0/126
MSSGLTNVPTIKNIRPWVRTVARARSPNCTLGKSSHRSHWTLGSQVELIRIDNKTARHIRDKFTQCWLCCYPRQMHCVHDKGGEFIGSSFQWRLELFNIRNVCSTSKNPQSTVICERMHQTVGNLR